METTDLELASTPSSKGTFELIPEQQEINGVMEYNPVTKIDVNKECDFHIEEPLEGETDEEYMNRNVVHEGTHVLYDGLTTDRKKQEKRAYRAEKLTIKQQSNKRKRKNQE